MRWFFVVVGAVALGGFGPGFGALPALAQPGDGGDDARQLKQLIKALQEKVERLDAGRPEKERVTQLGSSRLRAFPEEPRMVVQIYDLSDLFALAPPYPAMHADDLGGPRRPVFPGAAGGEYSGGVMGMGMGGMGMGGMGGAGGGAGEGMGGVGAGYFNLPGTPAAAGARVPRQVRPQMFAGTTDADAARTSINQLIEAITNTIAPTEWDDVGGESSIAPLGNELLILATEDTHEQIDRLLDTFRKRWGTLRTVSTDAHWLWLTGRELSRALGATKVPAGETPAYGMVDDDAFEAILEHAADPEQDRPGAYHAVVTCYNGQTVHTLAGGQQIAVTQMIPVVDGGKTGPGYHPGVITLQTGAALQVTPIVSVSGKYVGLDVHSRVVQLEEAGTGPAALPDGDAAAGLSAQVAAALDRPQLARHHLETTLRLPVGRRMLIGGMTFAGEPDPGQPGLYLFVKASVQELRDDATERSIGTEPQAAKPEKPKPAPPPAKKTQRRQ